INFGQHINWVYTPNTGGSLGIGTENEILLEFNTTDILPGEYNCLLKIYSNIENRSIPINLIVEEPNTNSNNFSSNNIFCWPNPASEYLNISSNERIEKIEIYDFTGRKIFNRTVNTKKLKIDINDFAPGLYLIDIRTGNKNYILKFEAI
ncbi:MAG TPA: T9SS type A sorting domain-containing protein, partial [Bacteroidales bacterium]|nr:T9SS type A sorting domain-containing protein [Bacteroidales bacterium]